MRYVKLLISILVLLAFSCSEEEINWQFNNQPSDLLVVEAVLTNENIPYTIKLTRPYQEQNYTPTPVSGANVYITTNDIPAQKYIATEQPIGSGLYVTDSMRAFSGKIYTLTIKYKTNTYQASATQPPVENMDSLRYHAVSENLFTLDFNEFSNSPNYITYWLNWQNSTYCIEPTQCLAKLIYYDLKNVDVIKKFAPNQERVDFPKGTIIIRKKYSVSEAYKNFLRGMLSETAWRGGPFDVYPANTFSNLSDGAIGFFAVSTVITDITIVK